MFDLTVLGDKPLDLTITPAAILGHEIDGLEGCYFYSRISAEAIKFVKNRFYTNWFDLKEELVSKNLNVASATTENYEVNQKLLDLAFNPKLGNSISFRYELFFCDDGKPLIYLRAINKHINELTDKWDRSNVPTILVKEIDVKILTMEPPITTMGFDLPIYPLLFAPSPLTMQQYESYCSRVMPDILAMVVKHTNYNPAQLAELIRANTPVRNEQRYLIKFPTLFSSFFLLFLNLLSFQ